MLKWLARPYPFPCVTPKTFVVHGLISAFVAFFLIVFQPFGLSESRLPNKNIFLAGYGFTCFAALTVTSVLFSFFQKNRTLEGNWNIAREILWMLMIVMVIALFNFLYSIFVGYAIFDVHSLLLFVSYTFAIAIFPVVVTVMLNWQKHQIKNEREGREINELLHQEKKPEEISAAAAHKIVLKAESGNEQIEVQPGNLLYIESMDNYSAVYFLRENSVQKILLRGSLKFMEGQLQNQTKILRCHRTYIVNLANAESATGNAQGYKLKLKNVQIPLPVSRNYLSTVLAEFKRLTGQS